MYSAEDYILFFLAVILFFGVLAGMGAFIEWQEGRQQARDFMEENRRKFQLPRRRRVSYVQEWEEILEGRNGDDHEVHR